MQKLYFKKLNLQWKNVIDKKRKKKQPDKIFENSSKIMFKKQYVWKSKKTNLKL